MKSVSCKILSILYLALFLFIYLCAMGHYIKHLSLCQWFLAAAFISVALIGFSIMKKYEKKLTRNKDLYIMLGCQAVMLILHILLIYKLDYVPHLDAAFVDDSAKRFAATGDFSQVNIVNGKMTYYFPSYPNNWAILFLVSWIYRAMYLIFGYVPDLTGQIFNIICIHISGILLFFTARLVFKDKAKPVACSLLFLINPAFYTNAPVLYTDTLSMPFVIGAVYCFLKAIKSQKTPRFIGFAVLSAVIAALGNSFKGSVAVLAVAFIIYSFMKHGWKKCLCVSAALIIALPGLNFLIKSAGISAGIADKELLNAKQLPMTHWINMSLKGDGYYNKPDRKWINQFPTYEEKNKACIESIKKRLSDYGFSGFMKHTAKKVVKTWTDGKYHSSFLMSSKNDRLKYFLVKGRTMKSYSAALQITLLTLMLASFVYGAVNSKLKPVFLVRLCVFGFALFFIFWEIKSRYLINFLPLMFIITADGLNYLYALICRIFKRNRHITKKQTA